MQIIILLGFTACLVLRMQHKLLPGKFFAAEILVLLSGAEMTKVKLFSQNQIDLRWLVKQRPEIWLF
ncbi:MAG: hypothetical protein A2Z73_06925 [Deltaproteobacteria bacterium RBG_13_60_28]|nr:MAG: hypothetical protein A2Z73_06925 [Deltaproteobacteria bacterium RBG_13_60_28]